MARVAITEYAAKRLCFGEAYAGVTATRATIDSVSDQLPEQATYVIKVDAGIKKRGKKGLLVVNVAKKEVPAAARKLFAMSFNRVVIEPFLKHEGADERYLSIELTRQGARVLSSEVGGVDIEDHPEAVKMQTVPLPDVLSATPTLSLPAVPLQTLFEVMQTFHFSFLEINPYLTLGGQFYALDMAVEIDSAKESKLPVWAHEHVLHKQAASEAERQVLEQDARTQAALNLHTLNPDGSILTLFSGGGASLVALDSLVSAGLTEKIINYSEYSGAPTRDETAMYVRTLLSVLFDSKAKNKVILVAGGVANFTDVMATFQGIVDAFSEVLPALKAQNVYVCVRRGGPNQVAGLAHLQSFLALHAISHDVHDPSLSLGKVGELVKQHV